MVRHGKIGLGEKAMKMNLPKELENDVVRLKEILNKAFAKASKKELNEMIWDMVVSNLPKEEAEEIAK